MEFISSNIVSVLSRIKCAAKLENGAVSCIPRLVAVSKTKPVEYIIEAYKCGVLHFGENYINELIHKSNDAKILLNCPNINWHFIGRLQSKTMSALIKKTKNLKFIETVESVQKAKKLNALCCEDVNVFIQVNTSQEEGKGGCAFGDVLPLAEFIEESCPLLKFRGLMTIGSLNESLSSQGDAKRNENFEELVRCQSLLAESLPLKKKDIELSMGMSNDFEKAVEQGSTNVLMEEEMKRVLFRREKNKLAAAKCRRRKLDRINSLTEELDKLEQLHETLIQKNGSLNDVFYILQQIVAENPLPSNTSLQTS